MKPSRVALYFALLLCLFFSGCQTNELREINRVKVGMDKQEVLDIMGNPRRTERIHGMDRWTYVFFAANKWQSREVRFMDGEVNHVGEPVNPAVTADDIDQKNQKSNEELALAIAKDHKDRKEYLDKWEPQEDAEHIKYLPEYKPLN